MALELVLPHLGSPLHPGEEEVQVAEGVREQVLLVKGEVLLDATHHALHHDRAQDEDVPEIVWVP